MIEIRHRFTGKIIQRVDGGSLYKVNLYGAHFCEANLYGADLRQALLRQADLRGADLRGANLSRADLYGANLYGADLRKADLHGADLRETSLRGADLSMCKGILSFTGEKHLLVYFKHQNEYYFKIGCMTKTAEEWLECFEEMGAEYGYGDNTKIYGDVIKIFSQYELFDESEGK